MKADRDIRFGHEKLEAYVVAREFLACADRIARRLPRGSAALRDQLDRAASSVLLNLAEGAGRRASKEKSHHFDIARGSATECAAVLDVLAIRRLAPADEIAGARRLLHRAVCMLSGLARSAIARSAARGP